MGASKHGMEIVKTVELFQKLANFSTFLGVKNWGISKTV